MLTGKSSLYWNKTANGVFGNEKKKDAWVIVFTVMRARNQNYRKLLMGAQNCTITFLSAPWKLWSFYFQHAKMSWYIQRSTELQYLITSNSQGPRAEEEVSSFVSLRLRTSWHESFMDVHQLQAGHDRVVPSPSTAWHTSFKSCRMLLIQPHLTKNGAHILCALSLPFTHVFKWWQQYIHKKILPHWNEP